jgi:hypothetical protein
MLGKLIKHEFNATGRIFLPIYCILLILSLVNRVLISIDIASKPLRVLRGFSIAAYTLTILATLVVTFVIMIIRFYKNLMSDEGYLMFTLPTKPSMLIVSKFIVSLIWIATGFIAVCCSLLLMLGTSENMVLLRDFINLAFRELKTSFGGRFTLLIAELLIMTILSIIQQIMLIYVSIAIGHLFSGHKLLGSFISYIGISTVIQIFAVTILIIWAHIAGTSIDALEALPQQVFPFSIIFLVVCSSLFYCVTNYIFNRKLNLE